MKDLGPDTQVLESEPFDTADNVMGRSFCALGDGATSCISSSIKYFRDDYLALMNKPVLAGAHA